MDDKGRLTIRVGKNTLSFTTTDAANTEQPITYKPYVVKSGVSMAANLREVFKTSDFLTTGARRAQVLIDSKPLLVPVEQFQESHIETLYCHSFTQSQQDSVTYTRHQRPFQRCQPHSSDDTRLALSAPAQFLGSP